MYLILFFLSLIDYVQEEATNALKNAVSVQITEEGIKTPLGVITIEQIEKGEDCSIIKEKLKLKKKLRFIKNA